MSETLNQAVRNLIGSGVQIAVATGNSDVDACTVSPASTLEAVTVGAAGTAHINDRQPFSNWGDCVDLFAPGASITSASHLDAASTVMRSGTSMAAPHVAGVMALWLQENPALTPAQLQEMIASSPTQNVVIDAKSTKAHLLYSIRSTSTVTPPPPPADTATPPPPDTAIPASAPLTAPAAPANAAGKVAALNRVDLSWADRSDNEDGFEIERNMGSGSFVVLGTVAANAVAYFDGIVQKNQTYTYRVRAYNPAGSSATSNEAAVTVTCTTRGKGSLQCK